MRPRPAAPWGRFPLSELVVLAALVSACGALASWGSPRGWWLVASAGTLGLAAGIEVVVREHFAGYRSHTAALAGAVGAPLAVAAMLAGIDPVLALLLGGGAFAVATVPFDRAFRHRS